MEAARAVKEEGRDNDLLERLRGDSRFEAVRNDLDSLMDPARFIGRAPQQVAEFLSREIDPVLSASAAAIGRAAEEVNV